LEWLLVEALDNQVGSFPISELDKRETTGPARFSIDGHGHV
jgi:hypothetical protein